MNFEPLSEPEVQIAEKIVDAAYTLDKALGPGLLEKPVISNEKSNKWFCSIPAGSM